MALKPLCVPTECAAAAAEPTGRGGGRGAAGDAVRFALRETQQQYLTQPHGRAQQERGV